MSVSQNISNCKASRVANISAAEFDAAIEGDNSAIVTSPSFGFW